MIGNKSFVLDKQSSAILGFGMGGEGGSTPCPTQLEQPTVYFIQQTFIIKNLLINIERQYWKFPSPTTP